MSSPHSSIGKESACSAGNPGSIPGSGRSAGKGIGYPLQYSWTSLVSQTVKNPPAMQETWVRSLGWEDPLEKGTATRSSILGWRIPWTVQAMGLQRVMTDDFHFQIYIYGFPSGSDGKESIFNAGSEVKVKIIQLCPTLCKPMDCIYGILQDRILE